MEPQVSLPQTGTEPVPVITDSLGTLDTLPPEVRNMVYALVFADGHPALVSIFQSLCFLPCTTLSATRRMSCARTAFSNSNMLTLELSLVENIESPS